MYYSRGNYEAFARPLKPEGVDDKRVWIIGSGLAGLSAAVFLVRDAQMPGNNITIVEQGNIPGGALDGLDEPDKGFVIRGGREMEAHFECLWDMFRSIPSLEEPGASVLDEFYWLNKRDPNFSLQRATINCGQDAGTDGLFTLSDTAQKEIMHLFLTSRKETEDKRINEVFSADFFKSNFWLYWRTMFAFEEWHSALEMKLYIHRFVNHISGMPDFSTLKFTKYNQYESLILPLTKYLQDHNVRFQYSTSVHDLEFAPGSGQTEDGAPTKRATRINWVQDGHTKGGIDLGANDYVFTIIGSLTENSDLGDHHTPAKLKTGPAPAWELWRRIAAKSTTFGHPNVFGAHIPETKWESATVTTLDEHIPKYIQKICKRDPFSGRVVTGGIVTARDSAWVLSWTINRQPHFKKQKKDQLVVWVYGLLVEAPGDYVKKPMQDCTGEEITQEWLYHLGVPVDEIPKLAAESATCVPVMMPYVTAFFMPRAAGDRPDVVPMGAENFAFLGQFAETGTADTIFTTEYSVRTGMQAVYTLMSVDRAIPEVFASTYDVRCLLDATVSMRDHKELAKWLPERLRKFLISLLNGTEIGELLQKHHLV
ncbi:myosin-cross-reactive antigen [Ophiostoma piceae UAMH 11346]|uniref:Myosin-cross-reactive antigen n=1 Tax=Ophiostoma piceae (strain UAMH 11346) TaxID=1262450 RepID=S3BY16_OPHP1|nr:myosin-cross-reactive antigen [Ophiostoma piceae UAMH 11346]